MFEVSIFLHCYPTILIYRRLLGLAKRRSNSLNWTILTAFVRFERKNILVITARVSNNWSVNERFSCGIITTAFFLGGIFCPIWFFVFGELGINRSVNFMSTLIHKFRERKVWISMSTRMGGIKLLSEIVWAKTSIVLNRLHISMNIFQEFFFRIIIKFFYILKKCWKRKLYFHFCVPFLTVVSFQIFAGEIGAWKDGRWKFLSFSVTTIDFETLETVFVFVAKTIQRINSYTWSFFESIWKWKYETKTAFSSKCSNRLISNFDQLMIVRVDFGMGFFRDPEYLIPIPGILDQDFLFLARSRNPENHEILEIGIGIWKLRKNPQWKIPKFEGSGSGYENLGKISLDRISRQKANPDHSAEIPKYWKCIFEVITIFSRYLKNHNLRKWTYVALCSNCNGSHVRINFPKNSSCPLFSSQFLSFSTQPLWQRYHERVKKFGSVLEWKSRKLHGKLTPPGVYGWRQWRLTEQQKFSLFQNF